jgi:hypothetical protein
MTDSKTMAETLTEEDLVTQARVYDIAHLARQVDLDEYIEKVGLYLTEYDAQPAELKVVPEELLFPSRVALRMALGLREFQKTFPTDDEMGRLADSMKKYALPPDVVAAAKGVVS